MAEYLAGEFRAAGFPAADIHVVPFEGVGDKTASLVVRYRPWRGNGKGGKPILLMAHMDVVAAKREDWERDPVRADRGERLLLRTRHLRRQAGRGGDHQHLPASQGRRVRAQPGPDHLLLRRRGDRAGDHRATSRKQHRALVDAEFALNSDGGGGTLDDDTGKPLYYSLQTAEKTYADFTVTARNPGGHSSQPRDDNAIYDLAAALLKVRDYKFPVMWNDTTLASFRQAGATTPGELGEALRKFAANPQDAAAAAIIAREPELRRPDCAPPAWRPCSSGGHGGECAAAVGARPTSIAASFPA